MIEFKIAVPFIEKDILLAFYSRVFLFCAVATPCCGAVVSQSQLSVRPTNYFSSELA